MGQDSAAAHAASDIDFSEILRARDVLAPGADRIIIEGVGGWFAPLRQVGETIAHLAAALNLPVILVVGMKLGCLNHAILTAQSIQQAGVTLHGWIANHIDPDMQAQEENLRTLCEWLPAPCLGDVPFLNEQTAEQVSDYLSI